MPRVKPSERELDVMQALWTLGREASVAEIHEAMAGNGSALAYTTVQTMLNRLATKGQVRRRLEGRAYHYAPAVKEPAAVRVALASLVNRFFAGSTADLAAHLVEEEMSDDDIKAVERLLAERKRRRS
ncbi:MAG TPA: BlaI/MecI/CopY family transcriptional regulator [Thermoanaerobaculia bacterium]